LNTATELEAGHVPPVIAFVPTVLVICPTIPDMIYRETYSKSLSD